MNKASAEAARQVLQALEERGGLEYLKKLPDELFVGLLRVILPKRVDSAVEMAWTGPDDQPLRIVIGEVPCVERIERG